MADAVICPNGHASEWPDYCSQCGAALAGAPAPAPAAGDAPAAPTPPAGHVPQAAASPPATSAAPAPSTAPSPAPSTAPPPAAPPSTTNVGSCPNCGASTLPTDVFCEACGTDLAAGAPLATAPTTGSSPTGTSVEVRVDREYFDAFVEAGALAFPDPPPVPVLVPVTKAELLVGRRTESRGVFPDIDAQTLTADPAVSHSHALLRRDAAGAWSVTDQGSTNGSRLDRSTDLLVPGRAYPLLAGSVLHVGAWTSIRIVVDDQP